jgi:hypothetical protein
MNNIENISKRLSEGEIIRVIFPSDKSVMSFCTLFDDERVVECYRCKIDSSGKRCNIRFSFTTDEGDLGYISIPDVEYNEAEELYDIMDNVFDISSKSSIYDKLKVIFNNIDSDLVIKYWENTEIRISTEGNFSEGLNKDGRLIMFNDINEFISTLNKNIMIEVNEENLKNIRESGSFDPIVSNLGDAKNVLLNGGIMIRVLNGDVVSGSSMIGNVVYKNIDNNVAYPLFSIMKSGELFKLIIFVPIVDETLKLVGMKSVLIVTKNDVLNSNWFNNGINNLTSSIDKVSITDGDEHIRSVVLSSLGINTCDYESITVGSIVQAINEGFMISSIRISDLKEE